MAFNANNEWVPESDDVSSRVATIAATDSPLMRQAAGLGMRQANRRGALNSSIAAGASRAATLAAAVPIASQEAQQIAAKNQARIGGDYGLTQTRLTLESNEREGAATRISQAYSDYNNTIANTLSNPKIKAADRASVQASTRDVLNVQLRTLQNLYPGANLNWGTG